MDAEQNNCDLTKLSLAELGKLQEDFTGIAAAAKTSLANVQAELNRRFAGSITQGLAQKGKQHGTITLPMQDRLALKCDVQREVKWDSPMLMAVAQTLPWERVQALFKITFEMSEAVYKGVSALSPEMREKIDAARTEKIKDAKIIVVKEDA